MTTLDTAAATNAKPDVVLQPSNVNASDFTFSGGTTGGDVNARAGVYRGILGGRAFTEVAGFVSIPYETERETGIFLPSSGLNLLVAVGSHQGSSG